MIKQCARSISCVTHNKKPHNSWGFFIDSVLYMINLREKVLFGDLYLLAFC